MTALRLGSLFDGIGVFPLAAVRCGIEPVWASEIEKAPISITKRHFPDMAHLGDVTKLDGRDLPPVHIITFGSPCQNLSQMLFERLYEDNVAGKIDDARFAKMSKRYEQEQGENAKKIKALRLELKEDEGKRMDIDDFLETVRRYTDATTITKRMVAELIDHIEVYHAEKQDGVTNQRVVIYYNCIGAFDVPDRRKIPEADIIMETIIIRRPSRRFFIDGQSPLLLACTSRHANTICQPREFCYLQPVNGLRNSPLSVVPQLCPHPAGA